MDNGLTRKEAEMVKLTPRTDAIGLQHEAERKDYNYRWHEYEQLARDLERELDECQQWRLGPYGVNWYIERAEKAERALAETKALMQPGQVDAVMQGIQERVIVQGDLSKLSPTERVVYYKQVCDSCGKEMKEADAYTIEGKYALCSYTCYGQLIGVL